MSSVMCAEHHNWSKATEPGPWYADFNPDGAEIAVPRACPSFASDEEGTALLHLPQPSHQRTGFARFRTSVYQ